MLQPGVHIDLDTNVARSGDSYSSRLSGSRETDEDDPYDIDDDDITWVGTIYYQSTHCQVLILGSGRFLSFLSFLTLHRRRRE